MGDLEEQLHLPGGPPPQSDQRPGVRAAQRRAPEHARPWREGPAGPQRRGIGQHRLAPAGCPGRGQGDLPPRSSVRVLGGEPGGLARGVEPAPHRVRLAVLRLHRDVRREPRARCAAVTHPTLAAGKARVGWRSLASSG